MRTLTVSLFVLLFVSVIPAKDKKPNPAADQEPVVFGMLSRNTGCVIFREFIKHNETFYGVAMKIKKIPMIETVETQNYTLDRPQWDETKPEDMNELLRLAAKDRIKFVKIPNEKPTEQQLENARKMCSESPKDVSVEGTTGK